MKLNIDWTKVDSRYKYVAMDSNGKAYLCVDLPSPQKQELDSSGNYTSLGYHTPLGYHATSVGEPNWKDTLTERPTEEAEMSAQNNTHPHAAMIVEWVKDTSRIVQRSLNGEDWEDCPSPLWLPSSQFRFADSVKPTIRSSLSDWELKTVIGSSLCDVEIERYRAIADAAAARAIEDMPKLEARIGKGELFSMYSDFEGGTRASLMAVVKAVVADCNEQLGKKK